MTTILKKLTEAEFLELQPLLSNGGGHSEAHEVLRIIAEAEIGDKFYLKRKDYDRSNASYINAVAYKKGSGYDFKVSIRTLKDKSGWVLLKITK